MQVLIVAYLWTLHKYDMGVLYIYKWNCVYNIFFWSFSFLKWIQSYPSIYTNQNINKKLKKKLTLMPLEIVCIYYFLCYTYLMVNLIFGRLIFLVHHLNFVVLCVDTIIFFRSQVDLAKDTIMTRLWVILLYLDSS